MEVIAAARALLFAAALMLTGFAASGGAEAQASIKVDDPKVLIVVFDYDGLAPMVMQISFILYTDGTFAVLRHGASAEDDETFVQGKLAANEALDLATKAQADLGHVESNLTSLQQMSAKGGFEVWHWNPADHLYGHPTLTGHPCDAVSITPSADPLQAFCRRVDALRVQASVTHHPVRTSFIFTRSETPEAASRAIPETVGAKELDSEIPILGICTDDAAANSRMADLIAPASPPISYRFRDLPPLELTQIIRATFLPESYDIPLGDQVSSVGDPCNVIRSE
ncbi:MAG TPA: hypothetical protein VHE77_10455 [Dongiaceae bacterium]|nr:hypothetical protein [Dongiaceae bacterium]